MKVINCGFDFAMTNLLFAIIGSWENEHKNAEEMFGKADVIVNLRHHHVWEKTSTDNEFEKYGFIILIFFYWY